MQIFIDITYCESFCTVIVDQRIINGKHFCCRTVLFLLSLLLFLSDTAHGLKSGSGHSFLVWGAKAPSQE